ncbi:MAG: DNA translocase FtsK [Kiritimatiellia bacterium]|jgi:S-DNA-T family DNA segregation ATPase FtsK/SpoIIIE|nr:DNA translocase FtsK [Kiritimatiellia bacterium]
MPGGIKKDVDVGLRRFLGIVFMVLTVLIALSVFSYDWRDVSVLKAPPNDPPGNLFGPFGAWLSFRLFLLFGVGGYLAPLWCIGFSLILLTDSTERAWPRGLWLSGAMLCLGLTSEIRPDTWTELCADLNIADPGGILGYVITSRLLVRWLSPVGAGILLWSIFAVSMVMSVRISNIVGLAKILGMLCKATALKTASLTSALLQKLSKPEVEGETGGYERVEPDDEEPKPKRPPPKQPKRPKPPKKTPPEPKPEPRVRKPLIPTPAAVASGDYQLPPLSLLEPIPPSEGGIKADTETTARVLVETLSEFGIEAQATNVEVGPVVTRYELLPAPGIRVEKIAGLSNNLALSLKATSVRVQAPIPGKGVVGVEVPNDIAEIVYLRELLEGNKWGKSSIRLPLALGKDVSGKDIVADLAKMPHLLIAGATGSGKTVCMNSILGGLLMSRTPDQLRLLLVDPKIVEFSGYNHLPHLVIPVVTDPHKVALALRWAIKEMERRFKLFAKVGVRNIDSFNSRVVATQEDLFEAPGSPAKEDDIPANVPYLVIVIDELADLMLAAGNEIENSVARLAQLSRAVGIHMIIATQRPSVNVITGTIKANFPARIAFQVAQKVDSRTILDGPGADKLLGRGDMLFLPPSSSRLVRAQGAMVKDAEINNIVAFIKQQAQPSYETEIQEKIERPASAVDVDQEDDLLPQAVEIIRETRRASTSSLQRRLRIGYTRAARIMDILEEKGLVGPPRGSDPREILIDLEGEIPDNAGPEEESVEEDEFSEETV